ncbi:isocitrate lyase [Bradyrhizobium sp. S3.9.2]|uniref:outer membrane protein n=1 Tax=Bradyrhizobium sp. S3.9.2 TaxID=3156432 RepID=UPI00339398C8
MVGGGVECGFKPHRAVKLEYDYLGLSNWKSPTDPSVALNRDLQMVKAGINYKFRSGVSTAAEPSTAAVSHEPSEDLQEASQNPIADLVSVVFQSNTNFEPADSIARRSIQHSARRADASKR